MSAVIFVALFALAWCAVRVVDRWLDRKDAQQRLARIREKQRPVMSNPRNP